MKQFGTKEEFQRILDKAMLTERELEVIKLRYFTDLTYEQISIRFINKNTGYNYSSKSIKRWCDKAIKKIYRAI